MRAAFIMQTRRPATLGVSITFFVIASVFVALRFISRIFIVRRVGLHDYLMLVAWVCASLGSLHAPGMVVDGTARILVCLERAFRDLEGIFL